MILSTHIVGDVADLCQRMAVMAGGRIQLEGVPLALMESGLAPQAFVANVVVRDDDTGFGPIIRATPIAKFDYLLGCGTKALRVLPWEGAETTVRACPAPLLG